MGEEVLFLVEKFGRFEFWDVISLMFVCFIFFIVIIRERFSFVIYFFDSFR